MTQAHIDVYERGLLRLFQPVRGGGRVERRAAVLPGFVYFVSIHTVPPVPRGPVGKVYRDVPEAYQTLPPLKGGRGGKGLTAVGFKIPPQSTMSMLNA